MVVAVPPIYMVLKMEARVVDAPPVNEESPVTDNVPPIVVLPSVAPPTAREVAKRLVDDAVELKKLVVVALVEVEFTAVKFCSVEEPVVSKLASVTRPVFDIEKSVVVAEAVELAIAKSVVFVSPLPA